MAKIKQKSDFNIDAAYKLIKQALYAPSVHCAYYSCFQLLKYTIKEFFGTDYDTQSEEIRDSNPKQSTHTYVINYIGRELAKLTDLKTSRGFKRKINDLKQFRVESDYHNIEIDITQGTKALTKANEIREYIVSNF